MPVYRCPCCGQQVRGFHKAGAAKLATQFGEILHGGVQPLITQLVSGVSTRKDGQDLVKFQADGDNLYTQMLDHVHGRARPGVTPDMRELVHLADAYSGAFLKLTEWARGRSG